jgi:hypothetical protein
LARSTPFLRNGCLIVARRAQDWSRLPGTTARVGVLGPKVKQSGKTAFVGGLAAGRVALSVMDFESSDFGGGDSGGIAAHKAWFFLPEGALALVHNVTATADMATVATTLDQCLLDVGIGAGDSAVVTIGNASSS